MSTHHLKLNLDWAALPSREGLSMTSHSIPTAQWACTSDVKELRCDQQLLPTQVTSTCVPCCKGLWLILHSEHGQTLHPGPSTKLCDCQMACYSPSSWGAAAKHNLDCLVSWLHNGWTSCPLTSGQLRHYPTDQSVSCPIKLKNLYLLLLYFSSESCLLIW